MALRRSPRNRTSSPTTPSLSRKRCSPSTHSSTRRTATRHHHYHHCNEEPESIVSTTADDAFHYEFHMDEAEDDQNFCYTATCTNSSNSQAFIDFFSTLPAPSDSCTKLVYGMDCEWQPIWFRAHGQTERVCVIQFYSPYTNTAMVFSAVEYQKLPSLLEDFLGNENIIKVGVNVVGDASRIVRDFECVVKSVYNVARRGAIGGLNDMCHQGSSMESLVTLYCQPACKYYVNKKSAKSVRLSDWGSYPLSENQIRYASLDAVLSFAIFYHQQCGNRRREENDCWDDKATFTIGVNGFHESFEVENVYPHENNASNEQSQASSCVDSVKNTDFFKMMRNRSIEPPNKGKKTYPQGPKDALKGVNVIISGVLDSMTREEMTNFVEKYGGKVSKSVTKSLTYLVNDVDGTVGESKLRQCKAKNIPVVGEDHIFRLVREKLQ